MTFTNSATATITSSAPPYVSPYLRPLLSPGRAGAEPELLIDDPVRARLHRLPPAELRVVRSLWEPARAAAALADACRELGAAAVDAALQTLSRHGLLFPDVAACEAQVSRTLSERLTPAPLVDQVELTNSCPMRCGFCLRGVPGRLERPIGFMAPELFARLLSQLTPAQRHYHALELDCFGESLLHPRVVDLVAMATDRGLAVELAVNPSLLCRELAGGLLAAGIRRIVISLDGMDDETLRAIRGPAAGYAAAERNLRTLLELAAAREAPPEIVIQMIDLARNRHQRDLFLATWGHLGLPFVTAYIKDLDGADPDTGRPSAHPVRYFCGYPFTSVCVLWDGRVVPCCRDGAARVVLGDLKEKPLSDIWYDEPAERLRAQHLAGDFPEGHVCRDCPWQRQNYREAADERHPDRAALNPLQW